MDVRYPDLPASRTTQSTMPPKLVGTAITGSGLDAHAMADRVKKGTNLRISVGPG